MDQKGLVGMLDIQVLNLHRKQRQDVGMGEGAVGTLDMVSSEVFRICSQWQEFLRPYRL